MSPRRRTPQKQHFPLGLYSKKLRGKARYYYKYPNGKEIYFPEDICAAEAIDAAIAYNRVNRNHAINLLDRQDEFDKPLRDWLPVARKIYIEDYQPKESALGRFDREYKRLLEHYGDTKTKSITLETVNTYLNQFFSDKSNNEYNRGVSFLKRVFGILHDQSAMDINPALHKRSKRKDKPQRQRLTAPDYLKMLSITYEQPENYLFLNIAMRLAVQTTQAVNEITDMKYDDVEWYDEPIMHNDLTVFGYIQVHRKKTEDQDASRIKIPITNALKSIIEDSKDDTASPYIVHRATQSSVVSKGCTHSTQLTNQYLSKQFSKLRDYAGIGSHLTTEQKPTFHELRALACKLFDEQGHNPQKRMAHSDPESTKIYLAGHVKWVDVEPAELTI